MLKAIAIDDEPIALEVIKSLVSQVVFISIEAYFTNPFAAIEYLQKNKIDLIFLDIKMPDISGMEMLNTISNPPMVIFTTAYSEHAVQSFELNAIDYLLKPFSLQRFLKACNKAHEQYELRRKNDNSALAPASIFIKSGSEQVRVELDDILYATSMGNYVQFILRDKNILSRLTMNEAEEILPAAGFIRIHRSYIVAKKQISKIDRRDVWVGKDELPVGAAYINEIEKFINNKK